MQLAAVTLDLASALAADPGARESS